MSKGAFFFLGFCLMAGPVGSEEIVVPQAKIQTEAPEKIDWDSVEEFAASVGNAYKHFGSDKLAEMIRASGVRAEELQKFQAEVRDKFGDKKLPIAVLFPEEQLKSANRRLWDSGLDFLELVQDTGGVNPISVYTEIPKSDIPSVQRLLRIQRYLGPTLALVTAVTVGVIMIKGGDISIAGNSASGAIPQYHQMLSPFIAAGVGGAATQILINKFLYPYSFKEGRGSYIPFRAIGKLFGKDFLFPLFLVTGLGTAISQMPPTVLTYTTDNFGSVLGRQAAAFALAAASVGLAEKAIEKLKRSGMLSQLQALKLGTFSSPLMTTGMMIFLTSNYVGLGAGVIGAYALTLSVPLWYKLLGGDRRYDLYTARVLAGEESQLSRGERICGKILGGLSRFIVLKR